jgi:hypothetical protein
MIEIFEEIEEFFQQKQFTLEQLDRLKESIEIKYNNIQTRKLANSAVTIKLLQYKLSGPLEARVERSVKSGKPQLNSKKSSPSKRLTKAERKKIEVKLKVNALIGKDGHSIPPLPDYSKHSNMHCKPCYSIV